MKFKFELENVNITNLDYNNICRFCLSNDGILLPIFGSAEAYHLELTTQINAILCLEIEENDGLPMSICHSCLYNLEKSNKFKSMCEQADAILRNHIKSPEFKVTTTEKSKDNACQDYLKGIPEENSKPIGDHVLTPPLESVQDSNTNFESPRDCDGEVKKVIEHKIHSEIQHKDISEKIKTKCDGAKTIEENSLLQMEERMNDLEEGMYGSEPFSLDLCSVRLQSESQGQDEALYPMSQLTDEEQWSDSVSDLSDEIDGMEPMTVTTPAGNCPGCNKSFSSSSDLERHQHIHKQEPPYPCDYCDQEFDEKAHLKAHWCAHARNKSHMCLTCGEAYVDRADLVKHFVCRSHRTRVTTVTRSLTRRHT